MGNNDSKLTLDSIPDAPEVDREKLIELMGRVGRFVSTEVFVFHFDTLYGVSRLGQSFAILVTKSFWYQVRVFVELENLTCEPSAEALGPIYSSRHRSVDGVQEKINEIRSVFNDLRGPSIYKTLGWLDQKCAVYSVPQDWRKDPDEYLKRGDVVLTCFDDCVNHAGVYIGDGQVIHYTCRGGERRFARRGQLGTSFVFVPNGNFFVRKRFVLTKEPLLLVGFGIRTRSGEEIARIAEERADCNWEMGWYNLVTKNCQQFANHCATGEGFMLDL